MFIDYLQIVFVLLPLLSLSSQSTTQNLEEWLTHIQDSVRKDKILVDKYFKTIGKYLKKNDEHIDSLESVRVYQTLLETELLNLTGNVRLMCMEAERLEDSLRKERQTVQKQTGLLIEYLKAKKEYLNDLGRWREGNQKLEAELREQTDALKFKKIEDVYSGMMVIELAFNELFKVKERAKQWSRFYEAIQRIVQQENTATYELCLKLKSSLKTSPENIWKDLQTYFKSADEFGQTVEQLHEKLSDDIKARNRGKHFSEEKLPKLIRRALQIILDAFFVDEQISKNRTEKN